jgi:hypothetical protein
MLSKPVMPMRYAIIVREYARGREFELCRVGTNPKAVVRALKRKRVYSSIVVRKIDDVAVAAHDGDQDASAHDRGQW